MTAVDPLPPLPPLPSPPPRTPAAGGTGPGGELLGAYPHVASCPDCYWYVRDWLAIYPAAQVVPAVLAHHDSGHQHDPPIAASEHFAFPG